MGDGPVTLRSISCWTAGTSLISSALLPIICRKASAHPPSLRASFSHCLFSYVCHQLGLFILRPMGGLDFGAHNGPRIRPLLGALFWQEAC